MGSRVSIKNILSGFPALKHRNFRLFWFGQCISLIGSWMQNIGQSWLVLELTHSALKLSIVTMLQFIPMMIFSLYAGTLVDRFPKRNMLIITQSTLAVSCSPGDADLVRGCGILACIDPVAAPRVCEYL
jgi:MFS family permease